MTTRWESELEQAVRILAESSYVVALVGAGLSVESGIPPFRGPGGLWTRFGEPPMNGYQVFLQDPKKWWEERVAQQRQGAGSELQQSMEQARPNPGHYALAALERMGVLKYTITQNADGLQTIAGCTQVAEIHGNRLKMRCIACNHRMPREEVSLDVLPPRCPNCGGIVKGDVVGFGEPIPPDVLDVCQRETARCDCMLLLGTSGTVYPAASFPQQVSWKGGALVEINPYETELSRFCAIALQGPTGEVLPRVVEGLKGALQRREGHNSSSTGG